MVVLFIGKPMKIKEEISKIMYNILKNRSSNWIFINNNYINSVCIEEVEKTLQLIKLLVLDEYNILAYFPNIQNTCTENIKACAEILVDLDCKKIKNITANVSTDISFSSNLDNADPTEVAIKIINLLGISINDSYQYTKTNGILSPNTYQYTEYEGTLFLEAYANNRTSFLLRMKNKLNKFDQIIDIIDSDFIFENYYSHYKKGIWRYFIAEKSVDIGADIIDTKSYLYTMLRKIITNEVSSDDLASIKLLQKKYEVTKKIYCLYKKNFISVKSSDYKLELNYLLFSQILSIYLLSRNFADKREKTIIFNTILKLNDAIVSFGDELATPLETVLAISSIENEEAILHEYKELYYGF